MRPVDFRVALLASDMNNNPGRSLVESQTLRMKAKCNPFCLQYFGHPRANVCIFMTQECFALLNDSDLRTETAKHLRKLKPDIATADHDEVLGKNLEVQNG
jgi:hypothetical protein